MAPEELLSPKSACEAFSGLGAITARFQIWLEVEILSGTPAIYSASKPANGMRRLQTSGTQQESASQALSVWCFGPFRDEASELGALY